MLKIQSSTEHKFQLTGPKLCINKSKAKLHRGKALQRKVASHRDKEWTPTMIHTNYSKLCSYVYGGAKALPLSIYGMQTFCCKTSSLWLATLCCTCDLHLCAAKRCPCTVLLCNLCSVELFIFNIDSWLKWIDWQLVTMKFYHLFIHLPFCRPLCLSDYLSV